MQFHPSRLSCYHWVTVLSPCEIMYTLLLASYQDSITDVPHGSKTISIREMSTPDRELTQLIIWKEVGYFAWAIPVCLLEPEEKPDKKLKRFSVLWTFQGEHQNERGPEPIFYSLIIVINSNMVVKYQWIPKKHCSERGTCNVSVFTGMGNVGYLSIEVKFNTFSQTSWW